MRVVQSETSAVHQPTLLELMSLTDWTRFVPETLGLLIVIVLLRNATGETSVGAGGMPHPLWIPVLLMSAQYGIMGGLFAVIAAGGAFLATDLTARSATQDFYDYVAVAAAQPCAWFAAALVLGGLRTLHIHNEAALKEQLGETKAAADDLAGRFEDAVGEIARLEYRIATDTATTANSSQFPRRGRPNEPRGIADKRACLRPSGNGIPGRQPLHAFLSVAARGARIDPGSSPPRRRPRGARLGGLRGPSESCGGGAGRASSQRGVPCAG